jgi:hypothetical protein
LYQHMMVRIDRTGYKTTDSVRLATMQIFILL